MRTRKHFNGRVLRYAKRLIVAIFFVISHHLLLRNPWGLSGPHRLFQVTAFNWHKYELLIFIKLKSLGLAYDWKQMFINMWRAEDLNHVTTFNSDIITRIHSISNEIYFRLWYAVIGKLFYPNLLSINCWDLPWSNATLRITMSF